MYKNLKKSIYRLILSLILLLGILPPLRSSAQTFVYSHDTDVKKQNDAKGAELENEAKKIDLQLKACNIKLENFTDILNSKTSKSYVAYQDNVNKKPTAPMKKKELKYCLHGCVDLLTKEMNYTFNPESLKRNAQGEKISESQAISGGLGSCQILESKYVAQLDLYSGVKKAQIEDALRSCPIAVRDLDVDQALLAVKKQEKACKELADARTAIMTAESEQLTQAEYDAKHPTLKDPSKILQKAQDNVTPQKSCPK